MATSKKVEKKDTTVQTKPPFVGIIMGLIVIAILGLIFFNSKSDKKNTQIADETRQMQEQKQKEMAKGLPAGWNSVEPPTGVDAKFEKKTENGIKSTVVFIQSKTDESDAKQYVESLIEGSKSAIPSLEFTTDTEDNKEGYYIRSLEGVYYNGDDKVQIKQNVYVKDGVVATITASYDDTAENIKSEVDQIFNHLFDSSIR